MKALISILLFCGLFLAPGQCCGRRQKKPTHKCVGGSINLEQGKVIKATETTESIVKEANKDKNGPLYKSYNQLLERNLNTGIIINGSKLGLTGNESQAVRLYTMGTYGLHTKLNEGLRSGKDTYPVFHYWLDSALTKLPKYSNVLYRGYKKTINIDNGKKLCLPGFTSASKVKNVARGYSSLGCTMLIFDSSRMAGGVYPLSEFPKELEYLIPPNERFEVYKKSSDENYNYIHLKPIGMC